MMDSKLSTLLDRLQARDFYDAIQAIEKLGASEDLTAAVNAVGKLMRKYGHHVRTREETEAAIVEAVEGLIGEDVPIFSDGKQVKDGDPMVMDFSDGITSPKFQESCKNIQENGKNLEKARMRKAIKEWQ